MVGIIGKPKTEAYYKASKDNKWYLHIHNHCNDFKDAEVLLLGDSILARYYEHWDFTLWWR